MNIDEVDFLDLGSGSAAFMHVLKPDGNGISIEFAVMRNGHLELTVPPRCHRHSHEAVGDTVVSVR